MKFKIIPINIFLIFLFKSGIAQTVNGYAQVVGISGTTITVNTVNEVFDTFEDGEKIIVMQMQDSVIGDTSNTISFGDLGTIKSAGLYEYAIIQSHTESAGIVTSITLSGSLVNPYNINANSCVQVISYPTLGSPDYTTASDIIGLAWDGNIGGVIAFEVNGTLHLNNNIVADGIGFRGGLKSDIYGHFNNGCDEFVFKDIPRYYGAKGEGIYKNTSPWWNNARGKILNGAGGGNEYNSGGGGGGGFTRGGEGGPGYGCFNAPNGVGGKGGIALSPYINGVPTRLYMGGGGGGGQHDTYTATDGVSGGGIIIIKANKIKTPLVCTSISVTANGNTNTLPASGDGAGGAGAGGTITINCPDYEIANASCFSVSANGGKGGDCPCNCGTVGGGGGGGQGSIIYPNCIPEIVLNNSFTKNGKGGANDLAEASFAEDGEGADNQAIFYRPRPVAFFNYTADCQGISTQFSDSSTTFSGVVNSWAWDFGDSTPVDSSTNPAHLYTTAGNYIVSLIVNNSVGCTDTVSETVPVYHNPVSAFTSNNVCLGDSLHFSNTSFADTPASITSWLWNFGDGTPADSSFNSSHFYSGSGNYNVSQITTTADGCSDTTVSVVSVFEAPVSAFTFSNICLVDSANFTNMSITPSAGTISNWSWNFGDGSPLETSNWSPNHKYSSPGDYTVTLITHSSNLGCPDTLSDTITVFPMPSPDFSVEDVCLNQSTFFYDSSVVFSSGSITNWLWDFADGSAPDNNQNPSHLYTTCGTFNVELKITNNNGCVDSIVKEAVVNCLPMVDAGLNDSVCFGENQLLQVAPNVTGYSYSWDEPSNPNFSNNFNPLVSPAITTSYSVTLTDTNGCSAADSVIVYADTEMETVKSVTNASCYGLCDGQISVVVSGGATPYQYSWSGGCSASTCSNLCAGTYSLTVTDAWGCTTTADTSITEPPVLMAFINNFTAASCNTTCDGTASATATGGTSGAGYVYSWNTSPAQNTFAADSLCAGSYICSITDANSCIAADTVVITAPVAIALLTTTSATDCNDSTGSATVNAFGGTPGYSFSWTPGGNTGQTVNGLAAGTYSVTVTDTNGCNQSQTAVVNTVAGATVIVTASDNNIILGNSTILNALPAGTYLWTPGTDLNCDTCQSPVASPMQTTTYCVVVIDTNNCVDSSCITILVEYPCDLTVPNAFSPNGDGNNDALTLQGWGKCVSDFSITIFDRWGEKVFENKNPSVEWNGTHNGTQLNPGVFVYHIEAIANSGEKLSRKGNISLIR